MDSNDKMEVEVQPAPTDNATVPSSDEVKQEGSEEKPAATGQVEEEESSSDDEPDEDANDPLVDPSTLKTFEGNELPYNLASLTWDSEHRRNTQHTYCYCGKPRSKHSVMLKCNSCKQWFHNECLKSKPHALPLEGDSNYNFKCAICTKSDSEQFELLGKSWSDIVRIAIYNLVLIEKRKPTPKRFFQYKDEICMFIDKHWDSLCHGKTRTKTWENTIGSALSTKSHYFMSGAEALGAAGYWGLKSETDPSTFRNAASAKAGGKKDKGKKKGSAGSASTVKSKKRRSELLGFEPDTSLPSQKVQKVRKPRPMPVPVFYPRVYFDPVRYGFKTMCLAKTNSAPQVKISPDLLTLTNEKGYRMARAAFGASEGSWYYEVEILPHTGNTRLGWCTEKGDVQAPVGYDKYSYSYRDKEGTKFHQSRGRPYGASYGPGDFIGFHINLPSKNSATSTTTTTTQESSTQNSENGKEISTNSTAPVKKEDEEPDRLVGSEITFYKNGVSQGVAFSNIYEGTYYPAASCYMGGSVKFNFGPDFKFPPPVKFTPMSDLPPQVLAQSEQEGKTSEENVTATSETSSNANPSNEVTNPTTDTATTSAVTPTTSSETGNDVEMKTENDSKNEATETPVTV